MLIFVLLVAVLVGGSILWAFTENRSYSYTVDCLHFLGLFFTFLAGIGLFVAVVILPVHRAETRAAIDQYEATIETLDATRERGNQAEITAIQLKVIELNQCVARMKYWSRSLWTNWFYDPRIEKLELIK